MTTGNKSGFTLEEERIDLPQGAWSRTHRRTLRWQGREVLGITQGPFRPYLHPVFSPAGFALTAESPADHPHHNGIWIAADYVGCVVPSGEGRREHYLYNFYVNDTFQGRAPGTIRECELEPRSTEATLFDAVQRLEWIGPPEWGADRGRVVATEERLMTVRSEASSYVLDLACALAPTQWDLTLGPTRHGLFNVRVAHSMRVANGGELLDADGRRDARGITTGTAPWVDFSGPVGGGHRAGVALFAGPGVETRTWFATDWGVLTLQPFRDRPYVLARGERLDMSVRLVLHDGDADEADVASAYRRYAEAAGCSRRDSSEHGGSGHG